jgi:hypothetical protein
MKIPVRAGYPENSGDRDKPLATGTFGAVRSYYLELAAIQKEAST